MGYKIAIVIILTAVALVMAPVFLRNAIPLAQKLQQEVTQYAPTFLRPAPGGAPVGAPASPPAPASPWTGGGAPEMAPEDTKGAVTISSLHRSPTGYSFTLRAHIAQGREVNITGWTIKTNRREIKIPQAVNLYTPSYVASPTDIKLGHGHIVYVSSGRSPLYNFVNFRTNLCTGYLNKQFVFSPPLANECPRPPRHSYQTYPGWCQRYIANLPSCGTPDERITGAWEGREGELCRKFIDEHFSFSSCVRNSIAKPDFFGNRWYAWLGDGISPFDPQHDWVRLYNRNGIVIDEYVY